VTLAGQVTDSNNKVARVCWSVQLQYDPERRLWQASAAKVITPDATPETTPEPTLAPAKPAGEELPSRIVKGGVTASTPSKTLVPE